MVRVRSLSWWDRFLWSIRRWQGFPYPTGEHVDCVKARAQVGGMLEDVDWGVMSGQRIGGARGSVPSSGVGSGTPMQRGRVEGRLLVWGQWAENRTRIPLPVLGGYWTTGYPTPNFDRRCIIAGADPREVCEIIQFDVGGSERAWSFGRWYDGELIEGKETTATRLPLHPFVWGPGSSNRSHAQALVVADYVGADGLLSDGPRAGDWVALDPASLSYRRMIAAGGECASRAIALVLYGARIIDRSGYADTVHDPTRVGSVPHPPKLHTQAGSWVESTNLHKFSIALSDLKRVIG